MQGVTIHPSSQVDSTQIGSGTVIWQNCVVLSGAQIGSNCNLNYNVFVENDVVVGNNVTVKSGVQLWDGTRVEDDVFIGPNAMFTNDLRPRAGRRPSQFEPVVLRHGASIGANVTIVGGVTIGRYAMIGAGSVVTRDIPDHTLWYGNPARFRSFVCSCGQKVDAKLYCERCDETIQLPSDATRHTGETLRRLGTIAESARIHEGVTLGEGVTVSHNAVIYPGVEVGDRTFVGPNVILGEPLAGYYQQKAPYGNPPLRIGANSVIRSGTVIYAACEIGDYFQTGHHVTVREHTTIGSHCSVGSYGDIQGCVTVGNYCRFHSNVHISQYTTIGNYVFIFPFAVLTNDPHPPSDTCTKGPTIGDYAVISAGAVLLPGIHVASDTVIGANSLVTKNVESEKVMLGVPARPICTIHDLKCDDGRLPKPYPWREHFSRGMPWADQGAKS